MESAATELAHEEARALFAPMVDCELGSGQEEALRSHLSHCRECQQGFEKYLRAVARVRAVGRERAPSDFTQQTLKRVRKRRRSILAGHGARWHDHVSIPAQVAIPIVIAVVLALLVVLVASVR